MNFARFLNATIVFKQSLTSTDGEKVVSPRFTETPARNPLFEDMRIR